MPELLLKVENMVKLFPGVTALDHVRLEVNKGEIHGLMGENGAGKSTLIKILSGVYKADEGTIWFDGKSYSNNLSVKESIKAGISIIYQELCLEPFLKVYENIMLGREVYKHGLYDARATRKKAAQILEDLGIELPLDTEVQKLDIALQQMVEIAKALSRDAKLIILDEPTSSLSDSEIKILFKIMRNLKDKGISCLFVSHKIEEIKEICDCITIFRDGKYIVSSDTKDYSTDQIVSAMVGREIKDYYSKSHVVNSEKVVLEVKNLNAVGLTHDISFSLRQGEVLGITGIVGAGRTEMVQTLFGLHKNYTGNILVNGKAVAINSPEQAIANGIMMVPENRKDQGIIPQMGVDFNITLGVLKKLLHLLFCDTKTENAIISKYMNDLQIKASSKKQLISKLSGGNQQKVILARWLAANPTVLILDEPTKGIDIGAKAEIYAIIDSLSKNGVSIIVISSELPEVINVSDRILVMRDKKIVAELQPEQFSQEAILKYSVGDR